MSSVIVRPTVRRRWPVREVAVLGPLLGAVWITADVSGATLVIAALVGLGAAVLWTGVIVIQIRRSSFGISDGELFHEGLLGRRVVARASEAVRVTRVPREDRPGSYWQVWETPSRGIALTEEVWDREELAVVARAWGATVDEESEPLSIAELSHRHPAATPWIARHAYVIPLAAFSLVALLIAIALLGTNT